MSKEYSVVIRTLGNGGIKYKTLLESIHNQTIKAKEIIVVIPYGYNLDYTIGNESVIFSKKGMITQRLTGIQNSTTNHLLVLDDDISFDNYFVEKLFNCLEVTNADIISPTNHEIENWHFKKKDTKQNFSIIKHFFLGNRIFHFKNKYAIKICQSGGHSILYKINTENYYQSQSGNFQCFFIKKNMYKKIQYEKEIWLESNGYAIYDDQVFFYKAFLKKLKIIFAPNIEYIHLDGKVSSNKTRDILNFKKTLLNNSKNKTIFWHKFIFEETNNILNKTYCSILFFISTLNTILFHTIISVIKYRKFAAYSAITNGIYEGFAYAKKEKNSIKVK